MPLILEVVVVLFCMATGVQVPAMLKTGSRWFAAGGFCLFRLFSYLPSGRSCKPSAATIARNYAVSCGFEATARKICGNAGGE
jgi:hypothetical protein